ncbi:TPA: ASCH/PUA domain-containing protein [Aeromonas veronii]
MIHELKIKPEYFAAVVSGDKTFEIRNNADRNFKVGDTLLLWEWDEGFTGQTAERTVSYITDFEQKQGYVVLGLANKREQELAEQLADATRQCGVMADLLRDSQRYVRYHLEHHECDARIVMGLISDIDTAMAGKLPAPTDGVTETIRTAPERIWLQVGDQSHYHSEPFPEHHDEVTWCADSVVACEVPYVRADLVGHSGWQLDTAPEGWKLVPFNPTTDQWNGLARAIIFWMRSYPSNQHTPSTLVEFITSYGYTIPKWMEEESEFLAKNHVISKGTAATLIYKAMLADCQARQGGEPCATEPRSSSPA